MFKYLKRGGGRVRRPSETLSRFLTPSSVFLKRGISPFCEKRPAVVWATKGSAFGIRELGSARPAIVYHVWRANVQNYNISTLNSQLSTLNDNFALCAKLSLSQLSTLKTNCEKITLNGCNIVKNMLE